MNSAEDLSPEIPVNAMLSPSGNLGAVMLHADSAFEAGDQRDSRSMLGVVLTCEHGGNRVPAAYRDLFAGGSADLESHRGWDPGTRQLAEEFGRKLPAPLVVAKVTRLLVDLNRSTHHRQVFSEYTRSLPEEQREHILSNYYLPHRKQVVDTIQGCIDTFGCALHVGIHSFTPELNGVVRNADVGLLYDPQRSSEQEFCNCWSKKLCNIWPELRVRRNYPYRGAADGLTTTLRKTFPTNAYLGIELEINQSILKQPRWKRLRAALLISLQESLPR